MNEATFWALLDKLDWRHEGNDDRVVAPVVHALTKLSPKDIESFEQILARKLYALDGRAWAREMGSGWRGGLHPISVDEFLYARCVAVVNGREFYETVLADPSQMLKDMEFESLLYLARTAWETKTGEEPDFVTDVSYETFSNEAGWPPADPEPELPPLPPSPKGAPKPLWQARIELWSAAEGDTDRQPSGLVASIELQRVSVEEVAARLLGVEPKGDEPRPGHRR